MTKLNFSRECIINGNTSLGIEFGSTRIKAILLDSEFNTLATSSVEWESYINSDGYWTYDEKWIFQNLQECYKKIKNIVKNKFDTTIKKIGYLGISGMMHGFLAFDKHNLLLSPFRTWRNTATEEASVKLSEVFKFNIPQRFSISHLYQAILNKESFVHNISYITTLSGFIHWKLTGEKDLGIGDASGMFPIDSKTLTYNSKMLTQFNHLSSKHNIKWDINDILPNVLTAGSNAGSLTKEGALLIDPTGDLEEGIPLCPPEGDAGTGMIATNCIKPTTANVSVGTSIFAMIVLINDLSKYDRDVDIVMTPHGNSVAMVHTNNGTTEINSWFNLFKNFTDLLNISLSDTELYSLLFQSSLKSDIDLGRLMILGYHSGEHITSVPKGAPLLLRDPTSNFTVANLVDANIHSAFATLKIGLNKLQTNENLSITKVIGHGGVFQTPKVVQRILAACMEAETSVFNTASEGGAWGISILAMYLRFKNQENITLSDFLDKIVFENSSLITISPTEYDIDKFNKFVHNFEDNLPLIQRAIN